MVHPGDGVHHLHLRQHGPGAGCSQASSSDGCTIYSYDAAGEATGIVYNDSGTPNVSGESYDGDGRRTAMTDGSGTSSLAYDSLGRLGSTTNGVGSTVSCGYDPNGHETSIVYPDTTGTVTQSFDPAGREQAAEDWVGDPTTYTYDADNDLAGQTTPTTGTPVVLRGGYESMCVDPIGVYLVGPRRPVVGRSTAGFGLILAVPPIARRRRSHQLVGTLSRCHRFFGPTGCVHYGERCVACGPRLGS